jgi:hypothetical protein
MSPQPVCGGRFSHSRGRKPFGPGARLFQSFPINRKGLFRINKHIAVLIFRMRFFD